MKFRIKLAICITVLLSLSFGVGGSLMLTVSFNASLEDKRESLLDSCRSMMSTLLLLDSMSGESASVDAARQLAAGNSELYAMRLSRREEALFETERSALLRSSLFDVEPQQCKTQLFSADGAHYYQISARADSGGSLSLSCLYDISALYEARARQLRVYRITFICVTAAGLLVAWGVSMLLTQQLEQLSRAARRIASGELSARASISSADEIGRLAADFDAMAQRLQSNYHALEDAIERREEFVGSFAHEMKTPMTSIIGYADMLRGQELSPEERREAAGYIFSEGKRLENLSFKLLDLMMLRKGELSLSKASPKAIVTAIVHAMQPIMKKQDIVFQCRCEEGYCLMDADLVRSLVINLVDNARKALDGGGNIFILSSMSESGCVLEIVDNGRGIPEESLNKLTEVFYRVDKSRSRAQGGVGLGLALCAQIAALHGGSIGFKSAIGKGTRVTVTLNGGRT